MKLVSINIEADKHYDTIFDFLKKEKSDVICLQELLEEDFSRFQKEFNMQGIFRAFNYVDCSAHDEANGKKQGVGVAIFTKNIVDSGAVFYFGREEDVLKSYSEFFSAESSLKNCVLVWADIANDTGKIFKVITTYLPVTHEGESSSYQLEVADSLLKELKNFTEFILCGDMNAPRGNETFTRLNKNYKDNIPPEYKTSIDQKLHRVKGIQFMVDCLFTTSAYKASNVKLVDGVSDHMAIVADIEKA